jgi:hypothetical protein
MFATHWLFSRRHCMIIELQRAETELLFFKIAAKFKKERTSISTVQDQ